MFDKILSDTYEDKFHSDRKMIDKTEVAVEVEVEVES